MEKINKEGKMPLTTENAARKRAGSREVNFEYFAPESKEVQVAGTFNGWRPVSLRKNRDGRWTITLDVKPGRYEYRFFVDGTWQNNQRPCECVPNAFGTWNCVLEVR